MLCDSDIKTSHIRFKINNLDQSHQVLLRKEEDLQQCIDLNKNKKGSGHFMIGIQKRWKNRNYLVDILLFNLIDFN